MKKKKQGKEKGARKEKKKKEGRNEGKEKREKKREEKKRGEGWWKEPSFNHHHWELKLFSKTFKVRAQAKVREVGVCLR